jgi:glycosyltransferase involved in cell wall biosynthesis
MSDDLEIRLVLSMIVKNESRVIERCLESARPLLSAVFVADTGSTDDTVKKIEDFGRAHNLRTVVWHDPWRNFGHNRTRAAERAAERAAIYWPPARTYMLCLDADMILHSTGLFDRQKLTEPWYEVEQRTGDLRWSNTRLCRLSHKWTSVGVTHEYWSPEPNCTPTPMPHLWIQDIGDGGAKGDKTARDIRLLTEGLETEPNNVRYLFYLAQSYFDIGEFAKAIPFYTRRRLLGGWDEEIWYSLYKIGRALLALGEEDAGMAALLRAHEERPHRAEPLSRLATHFRLAGKNNLAFMFAERARALPRSGDKLFVESDANDKEPLYETSIVGYYAVGGRAIGAEAAEKLVLRRGESADRYDHFACNQTFYLSEFPSLGKGTFPVPAGLDDKYGLPYVATNPTIAPAAKAYNSFDVHLRLVNYTQRNGRYYDPHGGTFLTRGAVSEAELNDDALVVTSDAVEIEETLPAEWELTRIRGLEDKRWVRHNGALWFTATSCQTPGAGGWPRVVLGRMSDDLRSVAELKTLDYGQKHDGAREKNWVPWSIEGNVGQRTLLVIYSWDPFVIVEVDTETGACQEFRRYTPARRLARFKGSSSPVQISRNRWLAVVHETAYMPNTASWEYSIYGHRWVLLEGDVPTVVGVSLPWYFDHAGVEYCCGLAKLGRRLIATYGVEDREARWATFDVELVLRSIRQWP